jgi:hypothetical protein
MQCIQAGRGVSIGKKERKPKASFLSLLFLNLYFPGCPVRYLCSFENIPVRSGCSLFAFRSGLVTPVGAVIGTG